MEEAQAYCPWCKSTSLHSTLECPSSPATLTWTTVKTFTIANSLDLLSSYLPQDIIKEVLGLVYELFGL